MLELNLTFILASCYFRAVVRSASVVSTLWSYSRHSAAIEVNPISNSRGMRKSWFNLIFKYTWHLSAFDLLFQNLNQLPIIYTYFDDVWLVCRINRTADTRKVVFVWLARSQTDSTLSWDVYLPNNRGKYIARWWAVKWHSQTNLLLNDILPIWRFSREPHWPRRREVNVWDALMNSDEFRGLVFETNSVGRDGGRDGLDKLAQMKSLCESRSWWIERLWSIDDM